MDQAVSHTSSYLSKKRALPLIIAIIISLLLVVSISSAYSGYSLAKNHFETKESESLSKEQEGLICSSELRKGHIGDIKSEYHIIEQHDCSKYMEYKNLPDDTEITQIN
jgi:predicted membrane protein